MNRLSRADIRQAIEEIVSFRLGLEINMIDWRKDLMNDLDSIDFTVLVSSFEEKFGLNIPSQDAEGFKTPEDVYDYVWGKQFSV